MRPSFVSPVSPFSGGSRLTTIRRDGSPPPPTPTGTRGTSKVMTGPGSAEICVWFKPVSPPPPPHPHPGGRRHTVWTKEKFSALPQENRQLWRQLLLSSNSRPSCCRCFLFLPLLPRRNADVFFSFLPVPPKLRVQCKSAIQMQLRPLLSVTGSSAGHSRCFYSISPPVFPNLALNDSIKPSHTRS